MSHLSVQEAMWELCLTMILKLWEASAILTKFKRLTKNILTFQRSRLVAAVRLRDSISIFQMVLLPQQRTRMMSLRNQESQIWVCTMRNSRNNSSTLTTENQNLTRALTHVWTLVKTRFQIRWTIPSTPSEQMRVLFKLCITTMSLNKKTQ